MTETSHTVATLRAALEGLPDDLPVYISSDEEGNSFSELWEVGHSKSSIEAGDMEPIHPDDLVDYDLSDLIDVVILWP